MQVHVMQTHESAAWSAYNIIGDHWMHESSYVKIGDKREKDGQVSETVELLK